MATRTPAGANEGRFQKRSNGHFTRQNSLKICVQTPKHLPHLDPKAGKWGPKISLSHGVKRSPGAVAAYSPQLLILDKFSQKCFLLSLD